MNRTQMRQKSRELHRRATDDRTSEALRKVQVVGGLVLNRATRRAMAYSKTGGNQR